MSNVGAHNIPDHIIGHLNWPTRIRFLAAVVLSLLVMGSIGYRVLRPWDPFGPISLLLVDTELLFVLRISVVLLAVAVLTTVIFDGRLPQFGTFAASIGLALPVAKTGGMDYLMIRLQAGTDPDDPSLWWLLALEMAAWTVPLAVMVVGSAIAERWVARDKPGPRTDAKGQEKTGPSWSTGILAVAVTSLVAVILIGIFCQSRQKGQVIFAVAAAFFIAAWLGDYVTANRRVVWQLAAVPVVAVAVYVYTSLNPARPAGLEKIHYLTPNNLSAVLPVEYLAAGAAAVVFGFWTSERVRFSAKHGKQAQR